MMQPFGKQTANLRIDGYRPVVIDGAVPIYLFPTKTTPIIRLDILRDCGTADQPMPLLCDATNRLYSAAGGSHSVGQVAEFLEARGIIADHGVSTTQSQTTLFFLRRYAEGLMDMLAEVWAEPLFTEESVAAYKRNKRQKMMMSYQKPSDEARRLFYRTLFPQGHPLASFAKPDDVDGVQAEFLRNYYIGKFCKSIKALVLAGDIDDGLISIVQRTVGSSQGVRMHECSVCSLLPQTAQATYHVPMEGVPQTSIRVGRVLPLRWDDREYAQLLIAITALGGYFGSRLMANLREDKGYTYGISAQSQIYREAIVFNIVADVASGAKENAIKEIRKELNALSAEPVPQEELDLVKRVIRGDFMRSIDGVFERSERLCNMLGTGVTDIFTDNLLDAIDETTAPVLQELGGRLLAEDTMVYCTAGG